MTLSTLHRKVCVKFLTTKFTEKKFHFLHFKYIKAADLQKRISLFFYAKPKSSRSNTEPSTNMVNVIHNRGNYFSRQAFSNDAAQIKDHTEVSKLELNVSSVYEGSVQISL